MTLETPPREVVADLLSALDSHARVLPPCVDHDAQDYQIHPCRTCGKWWAEVVHDSHGRLVVREWHDSSCDALHEKAGMTD